MRLPPLLLQRGVWLLPLLLQRGAWLLRAQAGGAVGEQSLLEERPEGLMLVVLLLWAVEPGPVVGKVGMRVVAGGDQVGCQILALFQLPALHQPCLRATGPPSCLLQPPHQPADPNPPSPPAHPCHRPPPWLLQSPLALQPFQLPPCPARLQRPHPPSPPPHPLPHGCHHAGRAAPARVAARCRPQTWQAGPLQWLPPGASAEPSGPGCLR